MQDKKEKGIISKIKLDTIANAFSDDIERSKNAGMNEHFTKPLEMEQIIKTVEKYIV